MSEIVLSSLSADSQLALSSSTLATTKQQLSIPKHELAVKQGMTFYNKITSYTLPTFSEELSGGEEGYRVFNHDLPQVPNSLIEADRKKALEKINNILTKVNEIKEKHKLREAELPDCPYQRTIFEYLGPNFIAPTIYELPYPQSFSTEKSTSALVTINKRYHDKMLTQLEQMTAEAADTTFPGMTSEHLGNAFAVLSTTVNGKEYTIDRHKAALHLEFAEIVRNLSVEDIIKDPLGVGHRLIARYIEINEDLQPENTFIFPKVNPAIPGEREIVEFLNEAKENPSLEAIKNLLKDSNLDSNIASLNTIRDLLNKSSSTQLVE